MAAKINFGTNSDVDGFISNFGRAFDEFRGYGWITEASINQDSPEGINIIQNIRDRNDNFAFSQLNLPPNDVRYTFIHLQFPSSVSTLSGISTPSAWEYELPNGSYRVNAVVGDILFTDSNHVINAEGQPIIDGFEPTDEKRLDVGSKIIEVTDGKLTIDAIGGENTKLSSLVITPTESARINFAPEFDDNNNPIFRPPGFINDIGRAYSDSRGFGWITEDSVGGATTIPLNLSINSEDRGLRNSVFGATLLEDTFIHMQYPEGINPDRLAIPAAWEYALANGTYKVTVSVGDGAFTDSTHTINIEGETIIDRFEATEDDLFEEVSTIVEIEDGKLTVDAIGGENTKINYIEIAPTIDVIVNFGSEDSVISREDILDFGEAYSDESGYGWVRQDDTRSTEDARPLSLVGNGRDRDSISNQLRDSFIHMQYPQNIDNPNAVKTTGAWEYALPNGTYNVRVSVGDPDFTDSTHVINIERNLVISTFTPSSSNPFRVVEQEIEITDGKLTIDAVAGTNTKLNFVEISSI